MNETLRSKVEKRRAELVKALEKLAPGARGYSDIDSAIRAVDRLTTGDMDKIPTAVAKDLTRWLDTSKYLDR